MSNLSLINYHLSIIIYEKKARTKTDYPKHRTNAGIQYPYFTAFQQ